MCFGFRRSLLRDVLSCHFCSTFIYSWRGNVEILPSELKASSTNSIQLGIRRPIATYNFSGQPLRRVNHHLLRSNHDATRMSDSHAKVIPLYVELIIRNWTR